MHIINYFPNIRTFTNGFQITFDNKYSCTIKIGPGTSTTQPKENAPTSIEETLLSKRFGGIQSIDAEVEVFNPNRMNISDKFIQTNEGKISFVTTNELIKLLYIISKLK
jgi:hypothetical protein